MTQIPINNPMDLIQNYLDSEETQIHQTVIRNPYTGEEYLITDEVLVQFIEGRSVRLRRTIPLIPACGDPILDPRMVGFCAILKIPFCLRCMCRCPFCGRGVSNIMSELMNFEGIFQRVCRECLPRAIANPITLPRPTLSLMPGLGGYLP